ncbi:MAG: clostripain-related cysteine peptidase [Phycisphaerae bacterium]|jgi:hypothetical protein|nr:clostripain-related cysteine peptidase [Phycisphaerae bacterium]
MGIEADEYGNAPVFEALEPRLLLSSSFDLDGDTFIGPGDDAIFDPAWQARGGYAFSDALLQPGDEPAWNSLADFDGDFHVGSGDYAWLSTNWGLGAGDPIQYPDDPHDDDQYTDDAFAQGAFPENEWFSDRYANMAIAGDDDWFYIVVPAGRPIVNVDCRFVDAEGNIDVKLYAIGGPIAEAASTTDNESLQMLVGSSGMHYLKVYSPDGPSGQRYDLRWWAEAIPDDHEQDDDITESDALGAFPQDTWYSELYGYRSVQADTDYFAMDIPADQTYLTIDATFNHAEGDISAYLRMEGDPQIIAYGLSADNNEHIEINLADLNYIPGRYYAWVEGPNSGQLYDFSWNAQTLDFRAVDDTATVDEDTSDNRIDVLGNDIGTDLVIVDASPHGTDGTYIYFTPYPNYSGQTYISYRIQQGGSGPTDAGDVLVTINPAADSPVALNDTASVDEDSSDNQIDVLANDSDGDGDSLTITGAAITSAAPIGTLWFNADYVFYTPNENETGTETIEYTIDDGTGLTDTAVVTVDVGDSPDDPVAGDNFFAFITGMHKNTLHVTGNDSDPDGDSFTIIGFPASPDDGDVTTDGLIVEYEPDEGFIGFDSFQYTIQDSTFRTATATVNVQVLPTSDIHEEDDNRAQADALGVSPKMVAPAHLLDEDFYMIEIIEGFDDRMTAELWGGLDIDMELLDADGVLVAGSFLAGPSNDRFIDTTAVSPGKYYVRVFSLVPYWGQGYVFQWDSTGPGDPHESDNGYLEADALGPLRAGVTIGGISSDEDYYRFEVEEGLGYVIARLTFDLDAGNLDLEIRNEAGLLVAGSYSTWYGDDGFKRVMAPGVYYFRVFNSDGYTGQDYELYWARSVTEDPHEEDDSIAQADAQGLFWDEDTFLGQFSRLALQTDDDYYRIDARAGFLSLEVDCWFTDGEGDIELYLLDAAGAQVAASTTNTDNERIEFIAPAPGAYYIQVTTHGAMSGLQTYDLRWNEHWHDDAHEADNDMADADDRGAFAADSQHDGTLWNLDFYAIDVPVGMLHVQVDARFTHADGDINIYLLESGRGLDLDRIGDSSDDNEFLDLTIDRPGRYYIQVVSNGNYTGQSYDLSWTALAVDDSHEADNSRSQADAKGDLNQNVGFRGMQWDDDTFRIDVPQGYENVTIDCTFNGAEGDIDILLVDSGGTPVTASTGLSDGEHIDTVVPSHGTYYIYVYDGAGGSGIGMTYRLRWSASHVDDSHETDNTPVLADQQGDFAEGAWFNGRAWNNDYFRIDVPEGSQRVDIDCLFTHADGNVTLMLYDEDENFVAISNSLSDNEDIDLIVPEPGIYYIKVLSVNAVSGQQYQLRWDARDDDAHESDNTRALADLRGTSYAGSSFTAIARDDDYYRIEVFPGQETIAASCTFSRIEGDIDLYLHDSAGQIIASSRGETSRESLTYAASPGTYYLRVTTFGGATGQLYNLTWLDKPAPEYEWNVMVYIAGDNNLSKYAQLDIDEMTAADLPDSVAVTLLVDDASDQTKQYRLGETPVNMGELNSGKPETLLDFINWSWANYPAEKTMLVLWDHGSGVRGACWDDPGGHEGLSLTEIVDVLDEFPNFDIIGFDACVMSTLEVAYQFRNHADYMVASEANIPGIGWEYNHWLDGLAATPTMSPQQLAVEAVDGYAQEYPGGSKTLSAVQLDKVAPVAEALDGFADAMLAQATDDDWLIVQDAKLTAQSFSVYRDIGRWMGILVDVPGLSSNIRGAAQDVLDVLPAAVTANFDGTDVQTTGLTVCAPKGTGLNSAYDNDLDFVADTDWEDFLVHELPGEAPHTGASPGEPSTPRSPAAPVDVLDVEYVLLPAPSLTDTLAGLPTALEDVQVGDTFYLEAWVKNQGGFARGIVGGYLDIWYDDMIFTPGPVSNGGIYTNFTQAEFGEFGSSVQFGGLADYGVTDLGDNEWARLGYVEFTATDFGFGMFMSSGGMDHFARAEEGKVRWWSVERDDPPTELEIVEQPPVVTVDLQTGSDTGASDTDNVTNDNVPTFDVTVNMPGEIYIDYQDDAEWDEVRWVDEAGTYEFAPDAPLDDGEYPVLVEFDAGLGTDSHSDPTTVDTVRPEVTLSHPFDDDSISETGINIHERYIDVTFFDLDGSGLDAATIIDGGGEFALSGPAAAGVAVSGTPILLFDNTYTYFFTGNFVAGAVAVDFTGGSFADIAGNTNDTWAEGFTVVAGETSVVDRFVFYNNSALDGNDPDANVADDAAIAFDKIPLLPGDDPAPANYTSYWRGINGIMLDIAGLDAEYTPATGDFGVRINESPDTDAWVNHPADSVDIRRGAGALGSDRVTLIWGDGEIRNRWVEVTVKSDDSGGGLGLPADDVFYFANAVGDGDGDGDVDGGDYAELVGEFGLRDHHLVTDFNADDRVDLTDFAIVRGAIGNSVSTPGILTEPAAPSPAPGAVVESGLGVLAVATAVTSVNPGAASNRSTVISNQLTANDPAAAIDLLGGSLSTGGYVAEPRAVMATRLQRAATAAYDLKPLSDDPAGDATGNDLLADVLEEAVLPAINSQLTADS